ncbi:MAG: hypothetical protein Q7R61_00065 [bacterium]|nr:hypothetical protein [bacterium]
MQKFSVRLTNIGILTPQHFLNNLACFPKPNQVLIGLSSIVEDMVFPHSVERWTCWPLWPQFTSVSLTLETAVAFRVSIIFPVLLNNNYMAFCYLPPWQAPMLDNINNTKQKVSQ